MLNSEYSPEWCPVLNKGNGIFFPQKVPEGVSVGQEQDHI